MNSIWAGSGVYCGRFVVYIVVPLHNTRKQRSSERGYPPWNIASGSGTRRDVYRNVQETLGSARLRPEPADGLDGRLESGLPLVKNAPGSCRIIHTDPTMLLDNVVAGGL